MGRFCIYRLEYSSQHVSPQYWLPRIAACIGVLDSSAPSPIWIGVVNFPQQAQTLIIGAARFALQYWDGRGPLPSFSM